MYPEVLVHNYATELATGIGPKGQVSSQAPLEVLVRACKRAGDVPFFTGQVMQKSPAERALELSERSFQRRGGNFKAAPAIIGMWTTSWRELVNDNWLIIT